MLSRASGPCFRESVWGLDLNWTTSPGYPWKQWFQNKATAFEHPTVRKNVYSGNCWGAPPPVWDMFGKLEILPIEKAMQKCRIITSCPVDVSLVVQTWYYRQNERLQQLCYTTPYGIGISKFGCGWHTLMSSMPDVVWQCDVSQFDSCVRPCVMRSVYDVRRLLFTDITSEYLEFEESWLQFLIHGDIRDSHTGNIYGVNGGNKSGSPNTSSDNTLANMLIVVYSLLRCGLEPGDHRFVCYGDDMLLDGSVPREVFDHYAEMGMIVKPGALAKRARQDAVFLGCTTKIAYGFYVPVWNGTKAMFSMLSSDSKRELRDKNRLQSLLLEALWTDEYPILDEYVTKKHQPVSRVLLEDIFFDKEVEVQGKNGTEEEPKKQEGGKACKRKGPCS